jgi:hypothetical protein
LVVSIAHELLELIDHLTFLIDPSNSEDVTSITINSPGHNTNLLLCREALYCKLFTKKSKFCTRFTYSVQKDFHQKILLLLYPFCLKYTMIDGGLASLFVRISQM